MVVTNTKEQSTLNPISAVDIPHLTLATPYSTCGVATPHTKKYLNK